MHEIVIVVAKYFVLISIVVTVAVWMRLSNADKKSFIALAVLGAVFSLILAKLGSRLYSDPRPFVVGHFTPYIPHANDNGFPSDHTLFTSFLAFTTWRYSRKAGLALLILAVLVGLSRVIAGVHHLVDIAGSILFAFVGVWLASLILKAFSQKQKAVSEKE